MVTGAYIKIDKISTVDLSFYVRNCSRSVRDFEYSVTVAVYEGERTKNGRSKDGQKLFDFGPYRYHRFLWILNVV